ncbi:MAG: glycine cleavage system aminomethyltransferase GcvT [Methyloligellaceae bacterium]
MTSGAPEETVPPVSNSQELFRTPLCDLHVSLGAKMVPFAGYEMPVQYPAGVLKEHLHTREKAGLFDVSHMGQIVLRAKSGDLADAARALETLVPVDVQGLKPGRQRYALFTNENGGIRDDLMVANRGDHLFLVVNAACKTQDFEHLKAHLADGCDLEMLEDRALLALQGPKAEAALATLAPDCCAMRFMDVATLSIVDTECVVSRSGYSGEDGFEISVPNAHAVALAEALLAHDDVEPIGLGARDSLRLEAGLCLYGSDLDETTTPVEAALEWAVQKTRRRGGATEGGFPGDEVVLQQFEDGAGRRRVGLKPDGRAPVRGGTQLYADEASDQAIGTVTSGGYGPSVEHPISMAYVATSHAAPGTQLFADVRGKRLPVAVTALPFFKPNYKRT